jgi:hypothetical protein
VEAHLSPAYLESLDESPWFFPLEWTAASSMTVLALRWHLSHQGSRRSYRIGVGKLAARIGLSTLSGAKAVASVERACREIAWAEVSERRGVFEFRLSRTGAVPVHSLRECLRDSLSGWT